MGPQLLVQFLDGTSAIAATRGDWTVFESDGESVHWCGGEGYAGGPTLVRLVIVRLRRRDHAGRHDSETRDRGGRAPRAARFPTTR